MPVGVTATVMYGQIVGFVLGFISSVTVTVTCTWNQWSKTSSGDSIDLLGAIWGFNGIWIQCLQIEPGQFQCDNYDTSVFELPIYMNTIRAFMCTAIICTVVGCFLALLGMQCTRLLDSVPNMKRKSMIMTGLLFMFAGMLTLASVIWFMVMVMQNFYRQEDNRLRYTLGATVWLGIGAALFCFITSSVFLSFPGPKEDENILSFTPMMAQQRSKSLTRPSYDFRNDTILDRVEEKTTEYV